MTKTTRSPSFAATVPLAATAAYGLGPFSPPGRAVKPQDLKPTEQGLWTAIHAAGRTGRQLLSVLSIFRDGLSEDALAFEAAKADPDDLAAEIDRLVAARLVERTSGRGRAHGSRLVLTSAAEKLLPPLGSSMSDPNATTSDTLAIFCRRLGITAPSRKQERADAIAACFADPEARAGIWKALSVPARSLLKAIADRGGPGDVTPETVGLSGYDLHLAQPSRYSVHRQRFSSQNAPLAELTYQGIVGANPYEGLLWIWREAWAMLERPLYGSWPSVAEPATAPVTETGTRLPPLLTTTERALQHWDLAPPPVLKNGELRLSKTVVRSTAKALSSDEATIELISLMALSLGLLLPNVARTTGRGRKRTVDEVWMADPDLRAAWSASPATTRWLRMVAEWTDPGSEVDPQLVANRHLVLWELASLPEGVGWANDAGVAAWLEHRYQPVGESEGFAAALVDLRTLGMVTTTGPTALTELGRLALRDPAAVAEADLGSADTAVVQADHTVV